MTAENGKGPGSMIKSELVQRIAGQNPHLYQRDIENIVNAVLGEITAALARGDRVELRGFGAFSVKHRPARTGRNPRTGETLSIKADTPVKDWDLKPRFSDRSILHLATAVALEAVGAGALARRVEAWCTLQAVEKLNLDGLLALWHPLVGN